MRSNKPFEDARPEAEKDLYTQQQLDARQMRQDRYQYERYKARLGDDAPKSFHAFRKVKKAGGDDWDGLQSKYRALGTKNKKDVANRAKSDIITIQAPPT